MVRRAQRKYREKKLMEVDTYKQQVFIDATLQSSQSIIDNAHMKQLVINMSCMQQIKELNARMRAMAEEKRALEKDKSRLERMVQAEASGQMQQPAAPQPCPPPVQVWQLSAPT